MTAPVPGTGPGDNRPPGHPPPPPSPPPTDRAHVAREALAHVERGLRSVLRMAEHLEPRYAEAVAPIAEILERLKSPARSCLSGVAVAPGVVRKASGPVSPVVPVPPWVASRRRLAGLGHGPLYDALPGGPR